MYAHTRGVRSDGSDLPTDFCQHAFNADELYNVFNGTMVPNDFNDDEADLKALLPSSAKGGLDDLSNLAGVTAPQTQLATRHVGLAVESMVAMPTAVTFSAECSEMAWPTRRITPLSVPPLKIQAFPEPAPQPRPPAAARPLHAEGWPQSCGHAEGWPVAPSCCASVEHEEAWPPDRSILLE